MVEQQDSNILSRLSEDLATAVDVASASVLTVRARRRMPASGISWSGDGLVVTANHVVERDDDIGIGLPDGDATTASLVGRDPSNDLALLRIESGTLAAAPRNTDVRPGNLVLAIGRPGMSGAAASFGVVSAVGKPGQQQGNRREEFIKADVAMLPGFSGGPLIDTTGRVLGLNSSTLWRGSGLTIPVTVIDRTVSLLLDHGKVRRGFLGIGAQTVDLGERLVKDLDLQQSRGLLVISIENGGPADSAGYLPGDIILSINGDAVDAVEGFQNALTGDLIGHTAAIDLIRGGALITTNPTVGERW